LKGKLVHVLVMSKSLMIRSHSESIVSLYVFNDRR